MSWRLLGAVLPPTTVALLPTATVEGEELRHFEVRKCLTNVTLPSVYHVFAAHQLEWNVMGKEAPWWSVLTGLPKARDVPLSVKDEFYRSGSEHVEAIAKTTLSQRKGMQQVFKRHRHRESSDAAPRVLEFGCGLGRLGFAFANDFGAAVTCVDQSVHHLQVARAEWKQRKAAGSIEFVVSGPDLIAAVEGRRFDFVHTVLVLQHMVPHLQVVYMEQFCDVLAVGGSGWLQVPIWTHTKGCDLEESIRVGGMQMHYTPANKIRELMHRRGCVSEVVDAGNAYTGGDMRSGLVRFHKLS